MVLLFKTIIWFLAAGDLGCCVQALAICRGGCSRVAEGGCSLFAEGDAL